MGTKRKQHSAQFKAEVAMAALSGTRTLAELASEYDVHPTMISAWKQKLAKNAKSLFEHGQQKSDRSTGSSEPAIRPGLHVWPCIPIRTLSATLAPKHCMRARHLLVLCPQFGCTVHPTPKHLHCGQPI